MFRISSQINEIMNGPMNLWHYKLKKKELNGMLYVWNRVFFSFLFVRYCISLFAYWYHIRSTAFFKNLTFARNVLQKLSLSKQTIQFDGCHFSYIFSTLWTAKNVKCWWFSINSETFIQVPVFDTFWRATIKSIYRKMKLSKLKLSIFVLNSIL